MITHQQVPSSSKAKASPTREVISLFVLVFSVYNKKQKESKGFYSILKGLSKATMQSYVVPSYLAWGLAALARINYTSGQPTEGPLILLHLVIKLND